MKKKNHVVVVGDILIDYLYWVNKIPTSGSDEMIIRSSRQSGGSAANTCVILSELGVHCSFCGTIGNDRVGKDIARGLQNAGINVDCLQMNDGKTGYTITLVEPSGERTMLSYRDSSAAPLTVTNYVEEVVKNARILYLSGYYLSTSKQAKFVIDLAKVARENDTIVMLDTSPIIDKVPSDVLAKMLSSTDIIMPNRQELYDVTGLEDLELAISQILDVVPVLVLKMGGEGSRLVTSQNRILPAYLGILEHIDCVSYAVEAEPCDTTGAGDSFNAGFIASYLRGGLPDRWLASGNATAHKVITSQLSRSITMK